VRVSGCDGKGGHAYVRRLNLRARGPASRDGENEQGGSGESRSRRSCARPRPRARWWSVEDNRKGRACALLAWAWRAAGWVGLHAGGWNKV
jgi:hypothetical protein